MDLVILEESSLRSSSELCESDDVGSSTSGSGSDFFRFSSFADDELGVLVDFVDSGAFLGAVLVSSKWDHVHFVVVVGGGGAGDDEESDSDTGSGGNSECGFDSVDHCHFVVDGEVDVVSFLTFVFVEGVGVVDVVVDCPPSCCLRISSLD